MSFFRCAVAVTAACLALPAAAANTTYDFTKTAKSSTGSTTTQAGVTTFGSASGQYTDGGTDYGNTITWNNTTNTTSPVTVSAWATTNVAGGVAKFEKAYIGNYSGDLGITSQPSATQTTNAELYTAANAPKPSLVNTPNETNSQHAIDNVGAYEALMFSFQSAQTISNLSIGFPGAGSALDSDATILYYTGSGDPSAATGTSSLSARTLSDLTSNGWKVATNIDLTTGANDTKLATSISSQYWLVGAYMNIGGPVTGTGLGDTSADYFKVNSITTTPSLVGPRAVPEPSTIALFGIAAAGMLAARRRRDAGKR